LLIRKGTECPWFRKTIFPYRIFSDLWKSCGS
jgi:hypothetical protein